MGSLAVRSYTLLISVLVTAVVMTSSAAGVGDRMQAPRWETQKRGTHQAEPPRGGMIRAMVHFFRTTITRVDGDRCPMYPTCSQYGEQALAKHGAVVGTWLFIDRLFHEWSEMPKAPKVRVDGVDRYWDPLEENDFWLLREAPAVPPHFP